MHLMLIRHGQTTSNVLGLLDSRIPGADLTPLGRRQAAAIPLALLDRTVTSVAVSNMTRTSQTADPLASARGIVPFVDPGLREIEAGDMEMASARSALVKYVEVAWAWSEGDLAPRMPGAEDGFEFFERFDAAIERAARHGGSDPVVVSHGASIRVWVGNRCRNVDASFAADNELHNTGTALIEQAEDGSWDLVEWNEFPLGGAALHGKSGPHDEGPTGSLTEDDL